ncbi:MAG: CBS domain-containing protein [Candidatus Omnitrophota bacterium]
MTTLHKVLVKELMIADPVTIHVGAPFSRVWEIFQARHIRHLPVVDDQGVLRGIITQRDLYRLISPRRTMDGLSVYDKNELDAFMLEHVMTKEVVTLAPEAALGAAIDLMVNKRYGCIPIVDAKRVLVGIVTQIDALKAVARFFV